MKTQQEIEDMKDEVQKNIDKIDELQKRVDELATVEYDRPDLELYRYETCSSLDEALDWYKKQDSEFNN